MKINHLKQKWNKEKYSYLNKEVGSGPQKFVKDILKSEDSLKVWFQQQILQSI